MSNNGISAFRGDSADEFFVALESPPGMEFRKSVDHVLETYNGLLHQEGLDGGSEVFLRFHLGDIANQGQTLKDRLGEIDQRSFVSLVGQAPAMGGKLAVEAYHIKPHGNGFAKSKPAPDTLEVKHGPYHSLWIKGRPEGCGPSYQQTQHLFGHLSARIAGRQATIQDNVIRTWLYVRDIDNNYQGMVDARRSLFDIIGLSKHTHYIASTGIEGLGEEVSDLTIMDSLALCGMRPEQVTHMSAPDYLCPTHDYNVTFERATRVTYGDRSHYYISGTASIDNKGEILHPEDIAGQTGRTLVNVEALLKGYGADLGDLKLLIVYLRDVSDAPLVSRMLQEALPAPVPYVMVRGAVCRPGWLVEMEGIAVSPHASKDFYPFCRNGQL